MCGEVEDPFRSGPCEGALHVPAVRDIALDPAHVAEPVETPRVGGRLQDREHLVAISDKTMHEVRAHESGGAGHKTADCSPSSVAGGSATVSRSVRATGRLTMPATIYGGRRFTSS